jgi:peptidoglycan/LPS O-acetylase OafA/YrhL
MAHALHLNGVALLSTKLLVAPVAFAATVIMALLSYRYFESSFLKLRRRFTVVASRPI